MKFAQSFINFYSKIKKSTLLVFVLVLLLCVYHVLMRPMLQMDSNTIFEHIRITDGFLAYNNLLKFGFGVKVISYFIYYLFGLKSLAFKIVSLIIALLGFRNIYKTVLIEDSSNLLSFLVILLLWSGRQSYLSFLISWEVTSYSIMFVVGSFILLRLRQDKFGYKNEPSYYAFVFFSALMDVRLCVFYFLAYVSLLLSRRLHLQNFFSRQNIASTFVMFLAVLVPIYFQYFLYPSSVQTKVPFYLLDKVYDGDALNFCVFALNGIIEMFKDIFWLGEMAYVMLLIFIVGLVVSKNKSIKSYSLLCLATFLILSVVNFHPFGGIRYILPIAPVIFYFCFIGATFLLQKVRHIFNGRDHFDQSILAFALVAFCLMASKTVTDVCLMSSAIKERISVAKNLDLPILVDSRVRSTVLNLVRKKPKPVVLIPYNFINGERDLKLPDGVFEKVEHYQDFVFVTYYPFDDFRYKELKAYFVSNKFDYKLIAHQPDQESTFRTPPLDSPYPFYVTVVRKKN